MISFDENFLSIETIQKLQATSGNCHVAQNVNAILLVDFLVPTLDERFVHFFNGGERAKWLSIGTHEIQHLGMAEVQV